MMVGVASLAVILAGFRASPVLGTFLVCLAWLTAARVLTTARRRAAEGARLSQRQQASVLGSSLAVALALLVTGMTAFSVAGGLTLNLVRAFVPRLDPSILAAVFVLVPGAAATALVARWLGRRLWPCHIGERVVIAWLTDVGP
jgi:hypothetical protein